MNRTTTLVLLALVAVLAWVVVRRTGYEEANPIVEAEPLFAGVDASRITGFRIENIRRSVHLGIEMQPDGGWRIVDPIDYRAEPAMIEPLLQIVRHNEAAPLPEAEAARAETEFTPPRAYLEVVEDLGDGRERRTRVEMGEVDLDGVRVLVRRDGRYWRTRRNLETALERDVNAYRSKRVFTLSPRRVVRVERSGNVFPSEGASRSVDLLAQREGAGWRIYRPERVLGDPDLFGVWLPVVTALAVERFANDIPDRDLAPYGLAMPWFSLELEDDRGNVELVHFGASPTSGGLYCRRDGEHHVFEITPRAWRQVTERARELYERNLVRVPRDLVHHVWLHGPDGVVRLTYEAEGPGEGTWSVAEMPAGEETMRMDLPADAAACEALLARIQNAQVARYLLERSRDELFPAGRSERGLFVEPRGDRRQGGWFGEAITTDEGSRLVPYVRADESVVAAVSDDLEDLFVLRAEDLLRSTLWELSEPRLRGLTLAHDGVARAFVRGDSFNWRYADAEAPATELRPVLDYLLFLKGETFVPEGARPPLSDVVEVVFTDGLGERHAARIGLAPDGEAQVEVGALRARLLHQDLHARLVEIVGRKPR